MFWGSFLFLPLPSIQPNSNDAVLTILYKHLSINKKRRIVKPWKNRRLILFFLSCSALCRVVLNIALFLVPQSETMECFRANKDQVVLSFLLRTYGVWKEPYTGINSGSLRRQKYGLEVAATDWDLKISFLLLALPVAGQFTHRLSASFPWHVKWLY